MNPNDPAYPGTAPVHGFKDGEEATLGSRYIPGLTKREYYAGLAMQGLLASVSTVDWKYEHYAIDSVRLADALIAELSK